MKTLIRRDLCSALMAFGAIGAGVAGAQTVAPAATAPAVLSEPQVFSFDRMPVRKMANGGESRDVVRGALVTGERVALHESVVPVGATPVELHVIRHSEFIVVRDGSVMFDHGDKSEVAGPGDVIYVPFGTMHRVRNVGSVPAKYVVVGIGGDSKK